MSLYFVRRPGNLLRTDWKKPTNVPDFIERTFDQRKACLIISTAALFSLGVQLGVHIYLKAKYLRSLPPTFFGALDLFSYGLVPGSIYIAARCLIKKPAKALLLTFFVSLGTSIPFWVGLLSAKFPSHWIIGFWSFGYPHFWSPGWIKMLIFILTCLCITTASRLGVLLITIPELPRDTEKTGGS